MSRRYLRPMAELGRYKRKFAIHAPYRNWRLQDRRWWSLTKTQNVLRYYNRDHPVWPDENRIDRAHRKMLLPASPVPEPGEGDAG